MKNIYLILLLCLLSDITVKAQPKVSYTPYFQFSGMYFSSKQVTSAGMGPGFGLSAEIKEHFLAKSDINLYMINGIAGSFRLALGYKRNGVWSPAGYLMLNSIFGSRTEFLLEDGSRPESPVFSIGLQLSLLRFENEKGFVSIFDIGYGPGNYHGKDMEASLLTVGIRF